jgi:hypothetical protein
MVGYLKQKKKGGNGHQTSLHSKLFQNDFVFCDVCCNMNEESAFEKLQRLTREVEAQRIVKHEKVQKIKG